MRVVDIHTHLLSKSLKFDRIYDKVALKFFGKRFGIDIKLAKKDPYLAYTTAFINNIKSSNYLKSAVVFGVDGRFDKDGRFLSKDRSVCASNDELLNLYKNNKEILIPFFSINPNRLDALDLIDRYVQLGFKGAKFLQNYWEIDLNSKDLLPYYKKLKSYNLPLIIHVGSESSIKSNSKFESINMIELALNSGVNVIVAHMALSYSPKNIFKALSKDPKKFNHEYYLLIDMLSSFDNLYADISAILTPIRAKVLRDLSNRFEVHEKLLYGSDFPVPFTTIFNTHDLSFKKRVEISKVKNPHDRYIMTILDYFKEDNPIWSNYKKLL